MIQSYFNVERIDNCIRFLGNLQSVSVRKVLSTIDDAVIKFGYQDIVFDFSKCSSAFSQAMLAVICKADTLKSKGIDITLVLPSEEKFARLFNNTNWAHLLVPDAYVANDMFNSRQFPATRYRDASEQNDVVNRIMDRVLSSVAEFDRGDFGALEWALSEVTDNVLNHSRSPHGGIVQLSIFDPRTRAVEFTVSDAGVGVHQTIRDAFRQIQTDRDALMESVKEGVTRSAENFQGNGLFGSLAISQQGTGRFTMSSGQATLLADSSGVRCLHDAVAFVGTTIDLRVNFTEAGQLARALEFKGKPYRPTDLIELQYESDALDQVVIRLAEHADGFRSRKAAVPLRVKIANIIAACPGQKIIIDFKGVSVVSSSFADEVFGKLFKELGPLSFMQAVEFTNMSTTVQGLVDRAISLRMIGT